MLAYSITQVWSSIEPERYQTIFVSEFEPYYGHLIGKLSNREEKIFCHVYAVDKTTVFVHNFTYLDDSRKSVFGPLKFGRKTGWSTGGEVCANLINIE